MPYDTFYEPKARSPKTVLDGAIDSVIDTLSVVDGTVLNDAPNTATIGLGEDAETILYLTKVGNILSDITRGFDPPGSNKGWDTDTPIARVLTMQDIMALKAGIDANVASIGTLDGDVGTIESNLNTIRSFLSGTVTQVSYNLSTTEISTIETVDWVDTLLFCQFVPRFATSLILVFVNTKGNVYYDGTTPTNSRRMFTRVYESATDTILTGTAHGLIVPASLTAEPFANYFGISHIGFFNNVNQDMKTFKLQFQAETAENHNVILNAVGSPGIIVVAEIASVTY